MLLAPFIIQLFYQPIQLVLLVSNILRLAATFYSFFHTILVSAIQEYILVQL